MRGLTTALGDKKTPLDEAVQGARREAVAFVAAFTSSVTAPASQLETAHSKLTEAKGAAEKALKTASTLKLPPPNGRYPLASTCHDLINKLKGALLPASADDEALTGEWPFSAQ